MKETRLLRNVVVWDRKLKRKVEIDVDVEVDVNRIGHQLALKAFHNDNLKSVALCGLVEVRVRGTKGLSE